MFVFCFYSASWSLHPPASCALINTATTWSSLRHWLRRWECSCHLPPATSFFRSAYLLLIVLDYLKDLGKNITWGLVKELSLVVTNLAMYTHWTTINWFTCLKQNGTSKGRQRWGTCPDQQRSGWGTESGTGCVDHTYQGWAHNGQWERQQSAAILARCPVCYQLCLCIAMFQILFDVPLFVETIQRGIGATADDNGPHTAVFSKFPPFPTNTWEIQG